MIAKYRTPYVKCGHKKAGNSRYLLFAIVIQLFTPRRMGFLDVGFGLRTAHKAGFCLGLIEFCVFFRSGIGFGLF